MTLYQAAMKSDRFEWVLQKGTELGVARFVPVVTMRTMPRDATPTVNRRARWLRIIREAAEQSERSLLPELEEAVSLEDASRYRSPRPIILAWEQEEETSLKDAFGRTEGDASRLTKSGCVHRAGGRIRSK